MLDDTDSNQPTLYLSQIILYTDNSSVAVFSESLDRSRSLIPLYQPPSPLIASSTLRVLHPSLHNFCAFFRVLLQIAFASFSDE